MSKLVPVDWRTFVKRLQELGFEGPYSGGKHPFMRRGDLVLTIPNPHKGTIGIDLLTRILRQPEFRGKNGLEKKIPEELLSN